MTIFLRLIEYIKLIVEYGTQIGDILNRKGENYVCENPFSAILCESYNVGICPVAKP